MRRNLIRSLVLAAVSVITVAAVGTPVASADDPGSCFYFADCNSVGGHISRATVIKRAQIWVDKGYGYSQATSGAVNGTGENTTQKWRRDCSGYVSMAWRLKGVAPNFGLSTSSLTTVSTVILYTGLHAGDILDDPVGGEGYSAHVIIFDHWVNGNVGGDFWMYEENPSYGGAVHHKASDVTYLQIRGIKGRAGDGGDAFVPRSYTKITNS